MILKILYCIKLPIEIETFYSLKTLIISKIRLTDKVFALIYLLYCIINMKLSIESSIILVVTSL